MPLMLAEIEYEDGGLIMVAVNPGHVARADKSLSSDANGAEECWHGDIVHPESKDMLGRAVGGEQPTSVWIEGTQVSNPEILIRDTTSVTGARQTAEVFILPHR